MIGWLFLVRHSLLPESFFFFRISFIETYS
jgi:hypothetical protein